MGKDSVKVRDGKGMGKAQVRDGLWRGGGGG